MGNGRYELTGRIAAGGMGEVWKGVDTALGRTVAVKLLHSNLADDPKFRSRFEMEARNAAALHDATIATIFDYGDDVDPKIGTHTAYLVMEYVDGVALSDLLTGPLPPERAAFLVAQVADGLAVAHAAGIVHRDVKPANFLVTPDGRVKVTDFGIARARGAAVLTDSGTIMGTPHYVAPEVAAGKEATPASDLYSLGVVLYECLSGSRPFTAATPVAVALAHLRDEPPPLPESVPAGLRALVASAMAKDPGHRPPTAEQFAAALRSATTDAPGAMVPGQTMATTVLPSALATQVLTPPASVGEPGARRPMWWLLVGLAAAVLLFGGVAWALNSATDSGASGRPAPGSAGSGTQDTGTGSPQHTATSPAQPPPPPARCASQAPGGVRVNATYCVGMDKKTAEDALKSFGLKVKSESIAGGQKDKVADVTPTGVLATGTEVTLVVYDGDSSSGSDEHGKGDEHGKAKGKD